jgi:serine/threonine protein kinase
MNRERVLTTPGMAVGSINYMSPEQARGENSTPAPISSLGLVLYEMSTAARRARVRGRRWYSTPS